MEFIDVKSRTQFAIIAVAGNVDMDGKVEIEEMMRQGDVREVAHIDLFFEKRESDVWGWGVLDPDVSSVSKRGKIDSLQIISNRFFFKKEIYSFIILSTCYVFGQNILSLSQ